MVHACYGSARFQCGSYVATAGTAQVAEHTSQVPACRYLRCQGQGKVLSSDPAQSSCGLWCCYPRRGDMARTTDAGDNGRLRAPATVGVVGAMALALLLFGTLCTLPYVNVIGYILGAADQAANGRTMSTPWTLDVDPRKPLPDYPRPQLQRREWLNLNGIWQFAATGASMPAPDLSGDLPGRIVVPFPVESALSGVFRHDAGHVRMYYKRTFSIPEAWGKQRVLLHFGAVDWYTIVSVDGEKVAEHRGGYDKFSADITDLVAGDPGKQHELLVEAEDPTETAHIPLGKQRLHPARHPSGIFYVSNSGIWQTVWLEPVPDAHILRVDAIPDIDTDTVTVTVLGSKAATGLTVEANVTSGGSTVGSSSGVVGKPFNINVESPHLWSPEDPHLYGLDVRLVPGDAAKGGRVDAMPAPSTAQSPIMFADDHLPASHVAAEHSTALRLLNSNSTAFSLLESALAGTNSRAAAANLAAELEEAQRVAALAGLCNEGTDAVHAYFGMRKIAIGHAAGEQHPRPLLNNKFVFHMGMLDQGFWPDGIYVAPTDAALRSDIDVSKRMGYNMLRKHIKVEPDRWYYWADTLGILVWQDMPCLFWEGGTPNPTDAERGQYEHEFKRIVDEHFSHPSIVMYVVFNEGWGQYETERVTRYAQSLDDSRLYNCASGWFDAEIGSVKDMHLYVGPGSPEPTETRAAVLGEFGGLGYKAPDHQWIPEDSFSYEIEDSLEQLQSRYEGLIRQVQALMTDPSKSLSAAVYTELTDVEAEVNGQLTYDRRLVKVDIKATYAVHKALLDASEAINNGSAVLDTEQLALALRSMSAAPPPSYSHSAGAGIPEQAAARLKEQQQAPRRWWHT